ncbi:MAG: MoaD/ThiS family protein [Pseudomonadales bacterium]|nr:MoaD/ThiS family protein [Halieaceae bacterium]MCP5164057.1 MoaD/ThiS family protein [Pseudomonadales bacterium]MCP5189648.1 MoaD/ThiS family protein [Pseudomonadales bacterium]MCP5203868.1 MoaD/ThiS family protein [Pseudomonadales bacterium]
MPKVKVSFISSFRAALGGADALEVEAATLRELMRTLVAKYPRMQQHIDAGVALAIDGQIYRDNWDVEIAAGAEVYLMPRLQGG